MRICSTAHCMNEAQKGRRLCNACRKRNDRANKAARDALEKQRKLDADEGLTRADVEARALAFTDEAPVASRQGLQAAARRIVCLWRTRPHLGTLISESGYPLAVLRPYLRTEALAALSPQERRAWLDERRREEVRT